MAKKKNVYVAPVVVPGITAAAVAGRRFEVLFKDIEDGCTGVLLAFTNKQKAKKSCPKGVEPMVFETGE